MHTYRAAQPALLYLSPACIGSVILCAAIRGELKDFWGFDDGSKISSKKNEGEKEEEKKIDEVKEKKEEKVIDKVTTTATEGRVLRSRG